MTKIWLYTVLSVFLATVLLFTGCTTGQYMTSFTPEEKIPDRLDMRYSGPRANIAVGLFTIKAKGAADYIGDGLREMLATALFESSRFHVLDRLDQKGLAAEQGLSYSGMATPDSTKLGGRMKVAELVMYGTVTEFEAMASGARLSTGINSTSTGAPVKIAKTDLKGKNAHLAIDVRVVDAGSGEIVAARRIAGSAASWQASIGADLRRNTASDDLGSQIQTPTSLGMFKNTPMELAIRDCIYRSVIYATTTIPQSYFKY